jgi:hypothetical protein
VYGPATGRFLLTRVDRLSFAQKYGRLVYFKCDLVENKVTLIKAGDFVTPFDNQQQSAHGSGDMF